MRQSGQLYLWEAEARFNVSCAKENWLVWEGDPCVVHINEKLHLGCAKSNGCFINNRGNMVHHDVRRETRSPRVVA